MSFSSEFILPVRVYYEDTDAGGVVYYANYLKFMERARTEWLRSLGVEQDAVAQRLNILFVVGEVSIRYRKPARFNEQIFVITAIKEMGKATITFNQGIWREKTGGERELLTEASVKVACISNTTWRATPIPTEIRKLFQ